MKQVVNKNYRPCSVNGKPAIFHRWAKKEQVYLQFNNFLHKEMMDDIVKNFNENHFYPSVASTRKVVNTLAIVEYDDGTVAEVEPSSIRFLDRGGEEK